MPILRRAHWLVGLLFVAASGLVTPQAAAQSSWLGIFLPTTETLWGVCFGGSQFVAVGENGTIITSPDGIAWTVRNSGTTAWLNGVTFANQLYVAVGSDDTILTSLDAITWTRRLSGGTRLNGIAYGNGRFIAVGEGGEIQISTDGFGWTRGSAGVSGWLRGIAFAQDKFLITGQAGTFLITSDGTSFAPESVTSNAIESVAYEDGVTVIAGETGIFYSSFDLKAWISHAVFQIPIEKNYLRGAMLFNNTVIVVGNDGIIGRASLGNIYAYPPMQAPNAQFKAVTSSSAVGIAVGSGGKVYRSTRDLVPPRFDGGPIANSTNFFTDFSHLSPGTSLTLIGAADGTAPLTYQWKFNGSSIPGATQRLLTLTGLSSTDAGEYTVTATNAYGTATSRPLTIALLPSLPNNAVDPTFKTSLGGTGVPLPYDPVVAISSSKIYVAGPFTSNAPDGNHAGLTRLNSDGGEDISFHAGSGVGGGRITQLIPGRLADEGVIVNGTLTSFNGQPVTPPFRLKDNGSLDNFISDPSYVTPGVPLVALAFNRLLVFAASSDRKTVKVTRILNNSSDYPFQPYVLDLPTSGDLTSLQTTDRSYRVIFALTSKSSVTQTVLVRFGSDGQLDPNFHPKTFKGRLYTLEALDNKIEYACYDETTTPSIASYTVGRLNEDGSEDPDFQPIIFNSVSSSSPPYTAAFDKNGEVLLIGRTPYPVASVIKRYNAQGLESYGYDLLTAQVSGSVPRLDINASLITSLQFLSDSQLLAVGSFTTLNGIATSGIARINLSGEIYATRLANLSIRTRAGLADQTLIAGFVVGGTSDQAPIVARGIGPTLLDYGVTGALTDPHITLFRGTTAIASNENWDGTLVANFAAVGAFALPLGSRDAALAVPLAPGPYALHISGAGSTTGIALAELYDASALPTSSDQPRLVNISGRAYVGPGDDALIAGFVVSGTGIKRLLIRAIGPTLTDYGVNGAMAEPVLTIYRGLEPISSNGSTADISPGGAATHVGAFPIAAGGNDVALVIDLSPGVYSAQVRGKNGSTGVALVEIYEVP